jgi:hypothetical protein
MCCVWVYWTTDHCKGIKQGISAAVEPGTAEMLNCMQTQTSYELGICRAVKGMDVKFTCRNFLLVVSFLLYVEWLRKYCLIILQNDFLDTCVRMNIHSVLSGLCSDESALNSNFNTFEARMVFQSY